MSAGEPLSGAREDAGRFMRLMFPLVTPFMTTPEQGAGTPIHLASSPEVAGVTGVYSVNRRPKRSSRASHNRDLARRLWEASAALVGVEPGRIRTVDMEEQV